MVLSLVQELLPRYDKLRSCSTGGSYDNWFMEKFHITKILNFKPFKSFYYRTYTLPFARERFNKEIRLDYVEFLNHLHNLQLKGKGTANINESTELIIDSLKKLPKPKKKNYGKLHTFWKIFTWCFPPSLIASGIVTAPEYYPLILLIGVMGTILLIPLLFDRLFEFLTHKYWYHICQKNFGISKLKKQLIHELIQADKS